MEQKVSHFYCTQAGASIAQRLNSQTQKGNPLRCIHKSLARLLLLHTGDMYRQWNLMRKRVGWLQMILCKRKVALQARSQGILGNQVRTAKTMSTRMAKRAIQMIRKMTQETRLMIHQIRNRKVIRRRTAAKRMRARTKTIAATSQVQDPMSWLRRMCNTHNLSFCPQMIIYRTYLYLFILQFSQLIKVLPDRELSSTCIIYWILSCNKINKSGS